MAKEFFSSIANELTIPRNVSPKFNGIYFYGVDNFYPYKLLQAYYNSPTHQSLVKTKVNGIMGEGIKVENEENYKEYLLNNMIEYKFLLLNHLILHESLPQN
jgi:hypothetical protein